MRLIDRAIAVDRAVDSPSRGRVTLVVPSVANPRRRASRASRRASAVVERRRRGVPRGASLFEDTR
jgi:hypothetical protein